MILRILLVFYGVMVMNAYNAFQILELKYYSTEKEVKERYNELVKQYHPDVCDWESTAYFQKINNAYEVALDFASKNKRAHKPQSPVKTKHSQPVKKNMSKKTGTYTRNSNSAAKTTTESSNLGAWIIIACVCLFLLILIVPGLQLIALFVILYSVTRILK